MKRRLFTILAAVSTLLFVAACVLWMRSYWVGDSVAVVDNRVVRPGDHGFLSREYAITSADGVLTVSMSEDEARYDESQSHALASRLAGPEWQFRCYAGDPSRPIFEISPWGGWRRVWRDFGMGSEIYAGTGGGSELHYVAAPYWFLLTCTGSFASFCLWHRTRARSATVNAPAYAPRAGTTFARRRGGVRSAGRCDGGCGRAVGLGGSIGGDRARWWVSFTGRAVVVEVVVACQGSPVGFAVCHGDLGRVFPRTRSTAYTAVAHATLDDGQTAN